MDDRGKRRLNFQAMNDTEKIFFPLGGLLLKSVYVRLQ
jgi:hypothetical protein